MIEITKAKERLEAMRIKAPAEQQTAIDYALMLLNRAIKDANEPRGGSLADWVISHIQGNEEWDSPSRDLAQKIILRLLA